MSDNYLRFEEYLDGYVVTGFTGDATVTNVEIPATHSDKTVYGVRGSSASEGEYISIFGPTYDGNIQSVTIADGITFVGVGAFANCDNLSSLVLPNTLQFIDEAAFYNCVSLPSVIIPNSVTTIGDFAFTNCKGLVSVTLPTNPIKISNYAFTGCSGLSNYSALALSRYGISPYVDVNPPKLISTDGLAVFLSKLRETFLLEKGNEYNMSVPDSVTYDQNGGITFNGMKLRDVNDLTKVGNVNLGLPITAGSNISLTASNGKLVVSSSAGQITIDDTLSTTSENAVQNKVVTTAINSKADLTNSSQVVTLGGLKDGNNASYKAVLPDTTNWESDKTLATTDQISGGTLYCHNIRVTGSSSLTANLMFVTSIYNFDSTAFTVSTFLSAMGNYRPVSGFYNPTLQAGDNKHIFFIDPVPSNSDNSPGITLFYDNGGNSIASMELASSKIQVSDWVVEN